MRRGDDRCVVAGDHHGAPPLGGGAQRCHHRVGVVTVLVAGRLVEKCDARLQEQAAGDARALLLAEARAGRRLVGDGVEGEIVASFTEDNPEDWSDLDGKLATS